MQQITHLEIIDQKTPLQAIAVLCMKRDSSYQPGDNMIIRRDGTREEYHYIIRHVLTENVHQAYCILVLECEHRVTGVPTIDRHVQQFMGDENIPS